MADERSLIVVADTSPLNYLAQIGQLELLPALFGKVHTPGHVFDELASSHAPPPVRLLAANPPDWLTRRDPLVTLPMDLDPGESAAISLALEMKADCLLVDDLKARNTARAHGLRVTGTLGILELASAQGFIQLEPVLRRLRRTTARISETLFEQTLLRDRERKAGQS